ncbi:MAG: site-2 protease family protein, partial [Bacteroidales bacterium]|nr:site-2 protease family protein [Bacteroidales bacterium]
MEIAVRIAQLLVSLSLLIVCHELGHFIAAKLFKTRVEKFYLFFDPWFSLFKFKKGETEYGIGWLPLGGYVKIAGMVDESLDTQNLKSDPEPWEFRAKPAWQRLIVMLAGVFVNFVLAMFIYAMVAFCWGSQYLPTENIKYGIAVDSLGEKVGLRNGDMIKLVNGEKCEDYNKVLMTLLLNDPKTLTVNRQGKDTTIEFSDDKIALILGAETAFMSPRFPFQVEDFAENSPAQLAGFQKDDKVVAFNGEECLFFDEVKKQLKANAGKKAVFTVQR